MRVAVGIVYQADTKRFIMTVKWRAFSLFDPVDTGLAESLFARPLNAEERLMLAVLENAIEHFQEYAFADDPKGKALFNEAEQWMLEKDSDWFYSFENICETLRLSPDYLRHGLLLWREAKRRQPAVVKHAPRPAGRHVKAIRSLRRAASR
jgi:hypothetical protein